MSQTSSAAVSSHLPTPSLPQLLITEPIVTIQTPGSMASEASVTDETVTEIDTNVSDDTSNADEMSASEPEDPKVKDVEEKTLLQKIETNVSGDVSNADDMSLSETDDLKGKDEEEKKFETNVTDDVSNANEANPAKPEDLEIETKVSDDVSNADEPSLSKPEDLKGNDEEEKIETSVSDDICNADEAISNPDDLKGKDEEEKAVQDSASVEAPTAETEENLEQKEEGTVIEEVNEAAIDESVSEPSVEAEEKEVMGKTDVPNTPESPKEPAEQPAEVSDASVTEDSIETPEEPSVSEIVTEEAKSVEESSEVFSVPDSLLVTHDKPVELPPVGLVQEPASDSNVTLNANETAEKSQEGEPTSQELSRNEISSSSTEDPINQVDETVETLSSESIAIVPSIYEHKEIEAENIVPELSTEKIDDDHNADEGNKESAEEKEVSATCVVKVSDTTPATEVPECAVEPEVTAKNEEQDSTVNVENEVTGNSEEVKASDGVGLIGEVKNENLEGKNLNLYKNTRNIDLVEAEDSNKASSIDPLVTDDKPVEPPTVGLVQEPAPDSNVTLNANETAEKSQAGEPTSQELSRNEISSSSTEDPINQESAEEKEVSATCVVKVSDTTPATEVPECAVEPEEPAPDSNVTLNANETAEKSQAGEPTSQELPRNETSLSSTEDPINQVNETVEMVSSEGIDIVPSIYENKEIEGENIVPKLSTEKAGNDHNADEHNKESAEEKEVSVTCVVEVSDTTPATEVPECAVEPEVNVKNVEQDNTVNVENEVVGNSEEVKASDGVGLIGEVKNESLEGVNLSLYKNTQNINSVEAEDSNKASSIDPLVTDDKPVEPPTVGLVQEPAPDSNVTLSANETAEKSQAGEPTSQELPRNETSLSSTEDPISKVHETVEMVSSEGIDIVPSIYENKEIEGENIVPELPTEKTDDDHNADEGNKESAEEKGVSDTSVVKVSDTTPATEVPECAVEPEVNVKNVEQDNTVNVENEVVGNSEEVKASDGVGLIGEVKNESLEGVNLSLYKNTQNINSVEAEDSNKASSIDPLVTDDKPVEPPTVGLVQEPAPYANVTLSANETAEKLQEGDPTSQELPRNETLSPITEDPISKVHETVEVESSEGIAIVPCIGEPKEIEEENIVPELPTEKTDDDHNADEGNKESAEEKGVSDTSVVKVSDTTAATEVPECAVQREVDVKNEEKETTLNVENETLLHKMLEESAEDKKKDNSDTKTDGEVPKTDVSGKKSQSPQNSILSKVKKSIAKVKKAITGKSPSLKTMITEGINDTKAK
ncbi:hypothetical protein C4D60_Mb01t26720 [Musa balbisiana]|uniref:Uncharacterized protein n=1 Tax=Musa balbisiana TaxID=52838 RepID=A0A4S8JQY8_MUSBA|nr:hypothetical protein C4D60_Mb01t26720 [Musa balbisiana]